MLRPRLRLPSRNIGEGDIKARQSPAYQARKAALTNEQVRLSVELAEESIAGGPDNRDKRREINGVVYDRSEPGVMVTYSIVDGEVVYLTFRDLYNS